VIAETAWVLERAYGLSAAALARSIEAMLVSEALVLEFEQQVFAAAIVLKEGRGSFSDGLIAALGANAGCVTTHTFDGKAARLAGFTLF
jgi:predicted nucleic-acid-binding protein